MFVKPARSLRRDAGFTLIELLVTLVIVTVGLLGVAKMQAAAVAETTVARTRSLMTYQAEALASAMRSNKAFWQPTAPVALSVTIAAGGVPTFPAAIVQPSTSDHTCVSPASACSASNIAYDDINAWATAFGQRFPAATGAISCTAASPSTCDITLTWSERTVAVNRTTAAGTSQATSTMVLHVQP